MNVDNRQTTGTVEWIGVRPRPRVIAGNKERQPMIAVARVEAKPGKGLTGDRYAGRNGNREVTLLQWENLAVIACKLNQPFIDPAQLRRNIAISGIDLHTLIHCRFRIGDVVLEGTGPCDPCRKMNLALGPGGEAAMQGLGGITARVIRGGVFSLGDRIETCLWEYKT
jgi:MOSC domain-containing protein YiiM